MQYLDVVSCVWFLFNSKISLFIYRRRRPIARLLKFPNIDVAESAIRFLFLW